MPFPAEFHYPAGTLIGYIGGIQSCPIHTVPNFEASLGDLALRAARPPYLDPVSNLLNISLRVSEPDRNRSLLKLDGTRIERGLGNIQTVGASIETYDQPPISPASLLPDCTSASPHCKRAAALAEIGTNFGYSALQFSPPILAISNPRSILQQLARSMHLNDPAGWPFAHSLVDYYRYHDSEAISVPAAAEVSDGLYVGNYLGALDVLRTRHLDYVISLCRTGIELDGSASSGMKHIEVWLNDTVEYRWNPNLPHLLETAAQTLNSLLSQRKTLLVHCVVGRSRSIALASYALALRENKPFDEVLLTITEQLPPVQLGPVVDAARELFAKRGEYFAV